MEHYRLEKDISIMCVTAKSFPDGILEAFRTLEGKHPSIATRTFFGISYMDTNGKIVYKAAAEEEYAGEATKYNCETFIITKGDYFAETIYNFMQDSNLIEDSFNRLLATPWLDKAFPCVEWYINDKEVRCMVRIHVPENQSVNTIVNNS
jgi:hypothetical protein